MSSSKGQGCGSGGAQLGAGTASLPTDAQGAIRAVTGALELVASERRHDLPWLLDVLSNSPARFAVVHLLEEWQIEDVKALAGVARKAAADLDHLERRRHWSTPSQIVEEPHLGVLYRFALRRVERMTRLSKQRRLTIIGRRLELLWIKKRRERELEAQKREIEEFLNQPSTHRIDPEWIRNFLEHG